MNVEKRVQIADCIAVDLTETILDDLEQIRTLTDPDRPQFFASDVALSKHGRGSRWADGAAGFSLVQTILPPNAANVAVGGDVMADGIYSQAVSTSAACTCWSATER